MLLQMFMGEKFGHDSIWESHLASQLWQTDLSIAAVLDEVTLSLRDVLQWKVGSRLMLDCSPDGEVELRCADYAMFKGRMGRSKGNIAVQISDDVTPFGGGGSQ